MARTADPDIDRRIIDAVRRLLTEDGYAALSMEAVAARAGTSKPALYRRFPTRAHLVLAASVTVLPPPALPDSGSLRTDLREIVRALADSVHQMPRQAAADQFATAIRDVEFAHALRERVHGPVLDAIAPVWDRAASRGEIVAGLDGRRLLADLIGVLVMRILYFHETVIDADIDDIVEHLIRAVGSRR